VPTTPTHEYSHDDQYQNQYSNQYASNNNNNNNSYTPTNSTTSAASASSTNNYSSSSPGSQGAGLNQASAAAMVSTSDLDNEQKATLIQTHVGDLLPGERVIMFLSNLLHVSCSRDNFQYSHSYNTQSGGGTNGNTMWCCAMTYYRLILFRTDGPGPHDVGGSSSGGGGGGGASNSSPSSSDSNTNSTAPSADWNAACWPPADRQPSILEMPLARYVTWANIVLLLLLLLLLGFDSIRYNWIRSFE
jgi:hypothetical protein